MELTFSLFYGSVRSARQGIKAARYMENKLKERGHKVHFIDALDAQLPLLDKMYKEYEPGQAPQNMEQIARKLLESDGILLVSGEYNHSVPPALKNMLDHFQSEYMFKPSAIASYSAGRYGGVRVAMHLRALLAELGMPSISSLLPLPKVQDNFDEEGNPQASFIDKSANRFLDEFEWYAKALKRQRHEGTPF